jgi:hypothetical protein
MHEVGARDDCTRWFSGMVVRDGVRNGFTLWLFGMVAQMVDRTVNEITVRDSSRARLHGMVVRDVAPEELYSMVAEDGCTG